MPLWTNMSSAVYRIQFENEFMDVIWLTVNKTRQVLVETSHNLESHHSAVAKAGGSQKTTWSHTIDRNWHESVTLPRQPAYCFHNC